MAVLAMWGRHAPLGSRPKDAVWLGRWVALSIGLHGLILTGIVTAHIPASAPRESSLRVRLVTEVRESSPLPAPPTPQRTRPRAPRPTAPHARTSIATPPPEMARPAETEPPGRGQIPPPDNPEPAAIPARPSAGSGLAQEAAPPSGAPSKGSDVVGELLPSTTTSVVETAPAPALRKSETTAQGIVLLPGGGGGETAGAVSGAGHRGAGVGGEGAGQGGRPDGGDGSGGAGRGGGVGGGLASRSGAGGDGIADLLWDIRRRIEQAKTYPDAARRAGMEGTVEVRFRIGRDGNAEALEIVRSSGHPVLDDDAKETIRRAGPYPIVSGRIRFPLSYRLDR